jgi:hypothetical protein
MGLCGAARELGEPCVEVLEVAGIGWMLLDFVEYREEVVERVDGR